MDMIPQRNRWSCSIAAAAMVTGLTIHDFIKYIGHDGSDIVFPDLPSPLCRKGFTTAEIIDAAMSLGWSVTNIECYPVATPDGVHTRDVYSENKIKSRMEHYFKHYSGVAIGERLDGRYWHCVAWDKDRWFDPSGPITTTCPINPAQFLIFQKTQLNS